MAFNGGIIREYVSKCFQFGICHVFGGNDPETPMHVFTSHLDDIVYSTEISC